MAAAAKEKKEKVQPTEKSRCVAGQGLGWSCDREVSAKGLCWGHYQQQNRGDSLRPLRPRGLVRLSGPRISEEAAQVLEERAKKLKLPAYQVVSRIIEAWAKLPVKERVQFAGLDDNRLSPDSEE